MSNTIQLFYADFFPNLILMSFTKFNIVHIINSTFTKLVVEQITATAIIQMSFKTFYIQ